MSGASTTRSSVKPLSGLHLLLTYECNFECDHCFVWGGPQQTGTMTVETIEHLLREARALGTIRWIYFEGGEPFLYYDLMLAGLRLTKESGFRAGIVSNASWATSDAEARGLLQPLAGLVDDLSISSDGYHGSDQDATLVETARRTAQALGIPVDFICVAEPEAAEARGAAGQLPAGESAVLYRGRAAETLASRAAMKPWDAFTECPWEDLRRPERVHVDPFGNLHVCQGISIGNVFEQSLAGIVDGYDPDAHPIVGPLLADGPAGIVRRYDLDHEEAYADHCHLCYTMRCGLRRQFPAELTPDQMYGYDETKR